MPSLPRAFEAAVYGAPRQKGEGFSEYLARADKCFARLKKEGVDLPDGAQGYIIYRQAALSESQEQRLLDKVIRDKGNGNFLVEAEDEYQEAFHVEDPYGMIASEEDDQYIFVQETWTRSWRKKMFSKP